MSSRRNSEDTTIGLDTLGAADASGTRPGSGIDANSPPRPAPVYLGHASHGLGVVATSSGYSSLALPSDDLFNIDDFIDFASSQSAGSPGSESHPNEPDDAGDLFSSADEPRGLHDFPAHIPDSTANAIAIPGMSSGEGAMSVSRSQLSQHPFLPSVDVTAGLAQGFADMNTLASPVSPTASSRRKRSPETADPSKRRSVSGAVVTSSTTSEAQSTGHASGSSTASFVMSSASSKATTPAAQRALIISEALESKGPPEDTISEASGERHPSLRGGRARGRGRGRGTGHTHNQVEREYRDRLKLKLSALLEVIPDEMISSGGGEPSASRDATARHLSKAEVLDLARRYIKDLEEQRNRLKEQRDQLRVDVRLLQDLTQGVQEEEDDAELDWPN